MSFLTFIAVVAVAYFACASSINFPTYFIA